MPILRCQKEGKLGYKWGPEGTCYIGAGARSKAVKQGAAIEASKMRQDEKEDALIQIDRRRANAPRVTRRLPKRLPKWLYPFPAERQYERELVAHINNMGDVVDRIVIPALPSINESRNMVVPDGSRSDDYSDDIENTIIALEAGIVALSFNKEEVALQTALRVNAFNETQWQKIVRAAFGVELLQREEFLTTVTRSFVKANVRLISKMERDMVDQIEGIMQTGFSQGQHVTTMAKEIRERVDVTRSKASFIARDQVGKLNGQLTELRQTNAGVTEYIWRDSDDARVRTNHAAKDGKKYKWSNPPSDTGHPGQDFQCRCYGEPVFDTLFEEVEV